MPKPSLSFLKVSIILLGILGGKVFSQDVENLKNKKPLTIKGNIGTSMVFYDVEGKKTNREPFSYILKGNQVISVYGIDIPFSFTLSDRQRNFRQPFNRLGASPTYKWVKVHLGYRNLTFSPYTLAGHTMCGVGVELTPSNYRFSMMHGRLLKAVETTGAQTTTMVPTPAFRRMGTSLKFGYGTEDNFVDFILLKASDDTGSISIDPAELKLTPSENLVVSIVSHQKLFKKLVFDLELSQSSFTKDSRNSLADSTSDKILLKPFLGLTKENQSSGHSGAIETSLGYQYRVFGIKVKYKKIDPGYRSMGAYYFLNDVQNITLAPSMKFFNKKLNLNGSLGFQKDNLRKTKSSQTKRTIGSLRVIARPFKGYNLNANYSNYGIGQLPVFGDNDTAVYELSQTTHSGSVMQMYNWQRKKSVQSVSLNYNFQTLVDNNSRTSDFSEYKSSTWLINYNHTILNYKITAGINYMVTVFNILNSNTRITGPSFNLSKSLLKNKLRLSASGSFLSTNINNEKSYSLNNIGLRAAYKPGKKHRFAFKIYHNKKESFVDTVKPFTETKGDVSYVYTF